MPNRWGGQPSLAALPESFQRTNNDFQSVSPCVPTCRYNDSNKIPQHTNTLALANAETKNARRLRDGHSQPQRRAGFAYAFR